MSLINILSEKVILPLSDLASGQSVSKKLDFLMKSQFWSREEIDNYQSQKLRHLVHHAYNTVPYYKDLFNNLRIRPDEIQSKEDLFKLPILTKSIIKSEGIRRFTSTAFVDKKKVNKSSSGSTGAPLFYYTTKEAYSMNIATNLRGWYTMNFRLGDKYIKLSQNARKLKLKRLQDKVSRNMYLNADPLIESNFINILKKIEEYKPKVIRCYPDPLLFLARYKQKHPEFTYNPSTINTTGNTLHPETRKEIESAFQCRIYDSYSSEGNSCIFECATHECYHSSEEYGISEIVNESQTPIKAGVGRLISTDLWNLAHPFIRYDTQDYVEVDDKACKCGSNLLVVKKILGRDSEILVLPTGRKFIVHNFTIFFSLDSVELNRSIEQFQVVKKKDDQVLFRLVVNQNFNDQVKEYIISHWQKQFLTPVYIDVVKNIPIHSNGKRRFIINE